MAKFLLGASSKVHVQVNKKCIQWSINFTLPDSLKESHPSDDFIDLDGIFVMDFYSDPHTGDYITHKGHRWQIVGREFVVTRHLKREPKSIPKLIVKYIGEAP